MELSEAERELTALLRGHDAPEFTLQISLREKHADPGVAGGRGWHLLERPVWTIAMSVPHVIGDRATTSEKSFEDAWQRQELWWRSASRAVPASGRRDYREMLSADRIERAEAQFLGIVRGEAGGEFAITIMVSAGHWLINLRIPGVIGTGTTGEGASFAYAWYHDRPWWQDMALESRAAR
jgi:hypothetical protein